MSRGDVDGNESGEYEFEFTGPLRLRHAAARISLRIRRSMFRDFIQVMGCESTTSVLDVGVTPNESFADTNYFERLYPWPEQITGTSVEDASGLELSYPGFRFVRTSGATLPFGDKEFEVAFSSAVLEHVGDSEAQTAFIDELLRVSHRCFVTTPNRWFPVDFHTMLPFAHWLPRRWHQWVLQKVGLTFWSKTENLNLLSQRALRSLFPPESGTHLIRQRLGGLTSNLIVYYEGEAGGA